KKPDYLIPNVELFFDLAENVTQVSSKLEIINNTENTNLPPLILHGHEGLTLKKILLNGEPLAPTDYSVTAEQLIVKKVSAHFLLEITVDIHPEANTALSGLYKSNAMFCTQCEAEGFRRITYFLDRPDVMSSYTVTLRADKQKYPVLLSNGNLVDHGDLEDGRHFAKWVDPFRKPSYLFALVAGQLVCREQRITSRNGREHLLQV